METMTVTSVTEEFLDLYRLPDTALVIIAKELSPEDLSNLCDVNSRFLFLSNYLPSELEIKGPDFHEYGPHSGHFEPEDYFDGPKMFSRVKKITMSFDWRDQGYGNRKGMIWYEVTRNGEIISSNMRLEDYESYPHVAPHRTEHKVIVIEDGPSLQSIRKGDILKFKRNVGGGGGHSLQVQNFVCILELVKC